MFFFGKHEKIAPIYVKIDGGKVLTFDLALLSLFHKPLTSVRIDTQVGSFLNAQRSIDVSQGGTNQGWLVPGSNFRTALLSVNQCYMANK